MKSEAKILIVDDIPDNLLLLCNLLEEQGYRVYVDSKGKSIFKAINEFPPDLILLDICLRGIDGYQICSELKANPKTKEIPIIFISALEDIQNKVKGFQLGGADYITKPFQVEEVIARIENQLTIQQQNNKLKELKEELLEQNQVLAKKNSYLELMLNLTIVMNTAETLESAIAQTLQDICQVIDWDYGEAWVLNSENTALEKSHHWYAKQPNSTNFSEQVREESLIAFRELVEKIAEGKQVVWLGNLHQLHHFNFSKPPHLLQAEIINTGLNSLLGIPIVFQEKVLAVLLFFSERYYPYQEGSSVPISPPDWLILMQSVGSQLGTLMQRLRTEVALKQANDQLQHLVSYDSLTGIANRRRFDEYLEEQWRQGKREQRELSLILCDLDAFKLYNDTLGHQAGDQCLQQVAKAIAKVVKRPMDLVARYGGEELAVILPQTSQRGGFQVAEKIREAVKGLEIPHPHSPVSDHVTISVGVSSLIPHKNCSPKTLIRMVDNALYQAKELGRDRVVLNNQCCEL